MDENRVFNLSDVLISRLSWEHRKSAHIDWLGGIRKGLPPLTDDWRELLKAGLQQCVVSHVIDQVPDVLPQFLMAEKH